MGLNIRPKSGRIANGSRLVVNGQNTQGSKVFPNSFNQKSNPYSANDSQEVIPITPTPSTTPIILVSPTVTPTNTSTPPVTPTNTSTPPVTPTQTPTHSSTPNTTPTNTPQPTLTPSQTPYNTSTPTITPTPTPSPVVDMLIDPILTQNDEYIEVGDNQYLMFVDTEV